MKLKGRAVQIQQPIQQLIALSARSDHEPVGIKKHYSETQITI